jgi:hypothetical protein
MKPGLPILNRSRRPAATRSGGCTRGNSFALVQDVRQRDGLRRGLWRRGADLCQAGHLVFRDSAPGRRLHSMVGGVGSRKNPTLTCRDLPAVFDVLDMNERMGSGSGDIMENTVDTADGSRSRRERSAVQNASSTSTLKLVLLWLVVGLPLLWGVMKALEDVGNLFP